MVKGYRLGLLDISEDFGAQALFLPLKATVLFVVVVFL